MFEHPRPPGWREAGCQLEACRFQAYRRFAAIGDPAPHHYALLSVLDVRAERDARVRHRLLR